jgi:hypothetical protein
VFSYEVKLEETDIGQAADWPVILATLGGLFLLGKSIKDNLEAWKTMAEKFVSLLNRLRKKVGSYRIDHDGATLLAVNTIAEEFGTRLRPLELIFNREVRASELALKNPLHLDHHPDVVYIQAYLVNKSILYLVVVKSKGSIEIKKGLDIGLYKF